MCVRVLKKEATGCVI